MTPARLDTIEGLDALLDQYREASRESLILRQAALGMTSGPTSFGVPGGRLKFGCLFCSTCGDDQPVTAGVRYWPDDSIPLESGRLANGAAAIAVFTAACVVCDSPSEIVAHPVGERVEVIVLSTEPGGGAATPSTPPAVRYYLDQAHRSARAGAHSAAATMYRAALEQLLFALGYKMRNLHPKIEAFETDANKPGWLDRLNPAYLHVLKMLGNGAIHPNDGDISRQDSLDRELLQGVRESFIEMLRLAYELPRRDAERLQKLQSAAAKIDG
jgi:hypothetical protein